MQKWRFNLSFVMIWIIAIGSISAAMLAVFVSDKTERCDTQLIIEEIPDTPEIEILIQPENEYPMQEKILREVVSQEKETELDMYPSFSYSRDWSDEDRYLLAKVAMAEAEGSSVQCMTLVIMSVLNRVESDQFPDSIQEVIFQYDELNSVYQFSCIGNGRWDRVEPDQNCYDAVSVVQNSEYDYSNGALYFESCVKEDNWHSRNLEFLYQCDDLRFYR